VTPCAASAPASTRSERHWPRRHRGGGKKLQLYRRQLDPSLLLVPLPEVLDRGPRRRGPGGARAHLSLPSRARVLELESAAPARAFRRRAGRGGWVTPATDGHVCACATHHSYQLPYPAVTDTGKNELGHRIRGVGGDGNGSRREGGDRSHGLLVLFHAWRGS
jgi:hypothetical protein